VATMAVGTVDGFVKALLVLARTADQVLETQSVHKAVKEPLSSSKVQILRLLSRQDSQTATQLAQYLGVTKPAVSQIIDAMVRRKLVVRKPGKQDRREVALTLTDQGKRSMAAIQRQQRQAVRTALRNVTAGNVKQWTRTVEQIAATVAGADKAYERFCAQCGAHHDDHCVITEGKIDCLLTMHEAKLLNRRRRAKSRA